jgi:kynurenine formamidase
MQLIDLSHSIEPGMPLFSEEAPRPVVHPWQSHEQAATSGRYVDCTCEISQVNFVTSIGTYLDSPYHFDPNGVSIEQLPLEQLVLNSEVINCMDVNARQPIGPACLNGLDLTGKAVLFHTGWSRYWGDTIYYESPFLTVETAVRLRDCGVKLVGVDFLVVDDPGNPRRPVHVTLLEGNILIIENLTNLALLPNRGFTFHAVPVKFTGAAAFPVRAYAVMEGENEASAMV